MASGGGGTVAEQGFDACLFRTDTLYLEIENGVRVSNNTTAKKRV